MTRFGIGLFAAIAGLSLAYAQGNLAEHEHNHRAGHDSTGDATIIVTLNPEARVSVARGAADPESVPCGQALKVAVKIVNKGFVTSPLDVALVGLVPKGVVLELSPEPLRGVPEEMRTLEVTLPNAKPADITLSFRLRNDLPDLGGRDRVHFLWRCHET